jgi:hypothetical protein
MAFSGRFTDHFWQKPTSICGALLIPVGIVTIIAQILEQVAFKLALQEYYDEVCDSPFFDCSLTDYAGYWCGVLIIIAAVFIIVSTSHINDIMIAGDILASVISFVFCIVTMAMSADALQKVRKAEKNEAYYFFEINSDSYHLGKASYAIQVITGTIGMILSGILIVITGMAILKGLRILNQQSNAHP